MANGAETTDHAWLATYDRAYTEGLTAYSRGAARTDCPYPITGSAGREGWLEGYDG